MLTNKIKQLNKAKAAVAALEASVASEVNKSLAALPAQYGFANAEAFAKAVVAASSSKPVSSKSKLASAPSKSGKRAKITEEIRTRLKAMVKAGKTGAEIAKALQISLPSVHNIKKALNLVKARE